MTPMEHGFPMDFPWNIPWKIRELMLNPRVSTVETSPEVYVDITMKAAKETDAVPWQRLDVFC